MYADTEQLCCEKCGRPLQSEAKNGFYFNGSTMFYVGDNGVFHYVDLTPVEAKLVKYLAERFGSHVHRERIYVNIWGYESDVLPKIIDVMVCKIKKKLANSPYDIQNKWGFGYGIFFRQSVGNCEPVHPTNPQENVANAH